MRALFSPDCAAQDFKLLILHPCQQVLERGKLTPSVLQLFLDSGHDRVLEHIQQLNIQPVPHTLPLTRNLWLGDKPNYY